MLMLSWDFTLCCRQNPMMHPLLLFLFFRTLTKEKFIIMDMNFLQHRSIPSENLKAILLSVIISKDRFSVQQVRGENPQFDRCQPVV